MNRLLLFVLFSIIKPSYSLYVGLVRRIAPSTNNILSKRSVEKKSYIIDIDGTICKTLKSEYTKSIPNYKNINIFNSLYEDGNEVHYWTARGANSGINWDKFTIEQLKLWGVKYNTLNMGKPHYDVWIDDKAINADIVSVNLTENSKIMNIAEIDSCFLNSNDGCEANYYIK